MVTPHSTLFLLLCYSFHQLCLVVVLTENLRIDMMRNPIILYPKMIVT